MRITHPFHPLVGQEFALIRRGLDWGEDRVVYVAADGALRSIATRLTDVEPPGEFQRIAAGRAAFRTIDLLELSAACERLSALGARPVCKGHSAAYDKTTMPHR